MSTLAAGKDPRDILIAPVVSEKSYSLLDEGKYTFIVDPRANKTVIKIAVERVLRWSCLTVTQRAPSRRCSWIRRPISWTPAVTWVLSRASRSAVRVTAGWTPIVAGGVVPPFALAS